MAKKKNKSNSKAKGNIIDLINFLFERTPDNKIDIRSIKLRDNINLYLRNDTTGKISFREFNLHKKEGPESFIKYVRDIHRNEKSDELYKIIASVQEFSSKEEFETSIVGEIEFLRLNKNSLIMDLFSKITDFDLIVEKFYNGDPKTYYAWLKRTIIDNAQYPYYTESLILYRFLYRSLQSKRANATKIFEETELKNWICHLFSNYVEDRNTTNFTILALMHYYNNIDYVDNNQVFLSEAASVVLYNHIQKYPEKYLQYVIRYYYTPHDDKTYTLEPFIKMYFKGFDNFRKFLDQNSSSKCAQIVQEHLDEYTEKGFFTNSNSINKSCISNLITDYI